jgi:2-polyprenyl-3-methyl-5-hydroxy-6-metoxy-1,4-benzoquinol methylase
MIAGGVRRARSVYEFTLPDAMITPAGGVEAFGQLTAGLPPRSTVLDCACGIGLLAIGLAEAGHDVCLTDISPAMVARTRAMAVDRAQART